MIKVIVLAAMLSGLVLAVTGSSLTSATSLVEKSSSKIQLKNYELCKDSQSDKFGIVPFTHENHSVRKYSLDGKSVIACVECHHTDQPKKSLPPPFLTSERDEVLTTAALLPAAARPVKTCDTCHLQAGDDSSEIPTLAAEVALQYGWNRRLTNDVAFHINCDGCHDRAIAARPALKGKIPGTVDCIPCHKPAE
jgi:hypothetical protein